MATKLTKPIYRETKINDTDYIVGIDPDRGVTFKKKGSRGAKAVSSRAFRLLIGESETTKPVERKTGEDMISYSDLKSRLEANPKTKGLMEIVDDIYEVNLLASDLSDEEIEKKGVNLPD